VSASPDLQTWLRFVGIGLLLFGVAFLFKYSDGESTMLHTIRVAIGVALGAGLLAGGHALLTRDRPFAQILTGGGLAVWYMSGFAAYQLFGLIPALPGFIYMAAVTAVAFGISVRQDSLPLAIVATLGGLTSPFLLHDPERSVAGVAVYVAAVASTAVAIHVRRGWWVLLWVAATGSAYAVMSAATQYHMRTTAPDLERWILQSGLLFLSVLFAVSAARGYGRIAGTKGASSEYDLHLFLVAMIPVGTVVLTNAIWPMSRTEVGQLSVTVAIIYGGATTATYARQELRRLTDTYLTVAAGMAAFGALTLIHGNMQHLAIATEALVLRMLWRRGEFKIADVLSHALFALTGLLVLRDLETSTVPATPLLNSTGVTTLWSIVASVIAAQSLRLTSPDLRRIYLYTAHALILAWVLQQFSGVASGQAIVTIVWGAYGAALMIVGLRRTIRAMRTVGLLTLLAVVVKLFLVDLVSVPAIWRVLLFIGFGGVFLALSYWFLSLDRSARKKTS
jgi:uncharacterized membrane protein